MKRERADIVDDWGGPRTNTPGVSRARTQRVTAGACVRSDDAEAATSRLLRMSSSPSRSALSHQRAVGQHGVHSCVAGALKRTFLVLAVDLADQLALARPHKQAVVVAARANVPVLQREQALWRGAWTARHGGLAGRGTGVAGWGGRTRTFTAPSCPRRQNSSAPSVRLQICARARTKARAHTKRGQGQCGHVRSVRASPARTRMVRSAAPEARSGSPLGASGGSTRRHATGSVCPSRTSRRRPVTASQTMIVRSSPADANLRGAHRSNHERRATSEERRAKSEERRAKSEERREEGRVCGSAGEGGRAGGRSAPSVVDAGEDADNVLVAVERLQLAQRVRRELAVHALRVHRRRLCVRR